MSADDLVSLDEDRERLKLHSESVSNWVYNYGALNIYSFIAMHQAVHLVNK